MLLYKGLMTLGRNNTQQVFYTIAITLLSKCNMPQVCSATLSTTATEFHGTHGECIKAWFLKHASLTRNPFIISLACRSIASRNGMERNGATASPIRKHHIHGKKKTKKSGQARSNAGDREQAIE